MELSLEEAKKYVGMPVGGWSCACGGRSGSEGRILDVSVAQFCHAPWGYLASVGALGGDHNWNTDLHNLFPEVEYPRETVAEGRGKPNVDQRATPQGHPPEFYAPASDGSS